MSGPIPLIGGQAQRDMAVAQAMYNTLFISLLGVITGVRLRQHVMGEMDNEEWKGEGQQPVSHEAIVEETRKLAIVALNDLMTNRPHMSE